MTVTYPTTSPQWHDTRFLTLQRLLQAGGTGSGGAVQIYQGRAPAAPDNPALAALDYPSGGGSLQQWDTGSASWV